VHGTLLASGFSNSLGRTVRPPLIGRKVFCGFADGGRRYGVGPELRDARKRGLTFPALQTIVSYSRLNCKCPNGALICRAIGPGPPSLPPPNGFTPIAASAT